MKMFKNLIQTKIYSKTNQQTKPKRLKLDQHKRICHLKNQSKSHFYNLVCLDNARVRGWQFRTKR